MHVEEEVGHHETVVDVEDWETAYTEIQDILERRFDFDHVEERRFLHHKDMGNVVSRIEVEEEMDDYTDMVIEFVLTFDLMEDGRAATLTIESRAEVVTEYPEESSWQRSPLYFALRSFWDKLVYGWARGRWEEETRDTMIEAHDSIRGALKTVS